MFVIQYCTTQGVWITIHACGKFADRVHALAHMREYCSSVVFKRVWPHRPHYRTRVK